MNIDRPQADFRQIDSQLFKALFQGQVRRLFTDCSEQPVESQDLAAQPRCHACARRSRLGATGMGRSGVRGQPDALRPLPSGPRGRPAPGGGAISGFREQVRTELERQRHQCQLNRLRLGSDTLSYGQFLPLKLQDDISFH